MYDKYFLYDYLINFYEFSGRIIDGILDMYDYIINGNDEDFPNNLPKKTTNFLGRLLVGKAINYI